MVFVFDSVFLDTSGPSEAAEGILAALSSAFFITRPEAVIIPTQTTTGATTSAGERVMKLNVVEINFINNYL